MGSIFGPLPYVVIKSVPGKRALKLDRFQLSFYTFPGERLRCFAFLCRRSSDKKHARQLNVIHQGGNHSECKKEARNWCKKEAFRPTGGLHLWTPKLGLDSGLINWTSGGQNLQAANDITCWVGAERKPVVRRATSEASLQQPEPSELHSKQPGLQSHQSCNLSPP